MDSLCECNHCTEQGVWNTQGLFRCEHWGLEDNVGKTGALNIGKRALGTFERPLTDTGAVLAQLITPTRLSTPGEYRELRCVSHLEGRGFAPGSRNPVTGEGAAFDGVAPAKRDGMYRSSRHGRASFR